MTPRSRTSSRDAVPPLAHCLIPNDDRLIPPFDETITLEPRHELIEGRAGATDAVRSHDVSDDTAGLITREQHAQGEELQVGKRRQLARSGRHKVALYTIWDSTNQEKGCVSFARPADRRLGPSLRSVDLPALPRRFPHALIEGILCAEPYR